MESNTNLEKIFPYKINLYFENEKIYRFAHIIDESYSSKPVGTIICNLYNISGNELLKYLPEDIKGKSPLEFLQLFFYSIGEHFDKPFAEIIAIGVSDDFLNMTSCVLSIENYLRNNIGDELVKKLIDNNFGLPTDKNDYLSIMKILLFLYDIDRNVDVQLPLNAFRYGKEKEYNDMMEYLIDNQEIGVLILPRIENKEYVELYTIYNFPTIVLMDMMYSLKLNIKINWCKNCGKVFIPLVRSDEIYCNNIFKKNKTCKQLGYENKVNADSILKIYRTIYKTQNARKQRNKHISQINERFYKWAVYAKSILEKCQQEDIDIDEMKRLLSNDGWIHGDNALD